MRKYMDIVASYGFYQLWNQYFVDQILKKKDLITFLSVFLKNMPFHLKVYKLYE